MAKQIGVVQFSGKLDSVVGARKSSNQKENTLRIRRFTIANPKTVGQCAQRVKMTPAQNFYSALIELLDHSFQGVKYIGPSYSEFLKNALLSSKWPAVKKGAKTPLPGKYLVSKGSLNNVDAVVAATGISIPYAGEASTAETTIADVSEKIIASNPTLQNGDQLTFIFCYAKGENVLEAEVAYTMAFLVLNTEDETLLSEWAKTQRVTSSITASTSFALASTMGAGFSIIGGAVVVSRPPVNNGSWQRSTTTFQVIDAAAEVLFSAENQQAAIDSYKKKLSLVSSGWPLNQGFIADPFAVGA